VKLVFTPSKSQIESFNKNLKPEKESSTRIIAVLGSLLFLIYTVIDSLGLPSDALSILVPVRILNISIIGFLFFLTFKPFFQKQYNKILIAAYYASGITICIGVYLSKPGEYSYDLYFAALLVLFITSFSWSYLPIKQTILMSLVFIASYVFIKIFAHNVTNGTEFLTFMLHVFYLVSVVVIAAIAQSIRDSLIYRNLKLQTELELIVDEKVKEAKKHELLANIDELTGIPNRRSITSKLENALTEIEEKNSQLTLVFIDLNRFKSINDNFGHDSGDVVLKTTAERLQQIIKADDYIARLGGDEFILGLNTSNISESYIDDLNEKIKTMVSAPIAFHGNILRVDVSVGYAKFPEDGKTIDELIKFADTAMYEDKQKSKVKLRSVVTPISA